MASEAKSQLLASLAFETIDVVDSAGDLSDRPYLLTGAGRPGPICTGSDVTRLPSLSAGTRVPAFPLAPSDPTIVSQRKGSLRRNVCPWRL